MKKLILIGAITLMSIAAQAKVSCVVNSDFPKENLVFDHTLYNGKATSQLTYLLLVRKGQVATINPTKLLKSGDWGSIVGQPILEFGREPDGEYNISVGTFATPKASSNVLQLKTFVSGAVSENQPLTLTLPDQDLAITCYSLQVMPKK